MKKNLFHTIRFLLILCVIALAGCQVDNRAPQNVQPTQEVPSTSVPSIKGPSTPPGVKGPTTLPSSGV